MAITPVSAERFQEERSRNRSMGLKDILVHVDPSSANQTCIDVTSMLAQQFRAHVTGLLVTPNPTLLGYPVADFGIMADEGILVDAEREQRAYYMEFAAAAEKRFGDQLDRYGIAFDWRWAVGSTAQQISIRARYADLVVIGQPVPDGQSPANQLSVVSEILLTAGRPAIVVPYTSQLSTIGERILIAWNGSREAARAVNDALPLLRRSQ